MNSLGELRNLFLSLGKEVKGFDGGQFESDGIIWGLAFENPYADHVPIVPLDWKVYVKELKAAKAAGKPVNFPPKITVLPKVELVIAAAPKTAAEVKKPIIRQQAPEITCPHCGKSGGVIGMKRWHFDKCKDKK